MAVYTKLSDQVITDLLSQYDIGEFVSASPIVEGVDNTNYLLVTSRARFILTVYEKRVQEGDLPFFMRLTEWLADRDIPCPRAIIAKDGEVICKLEGKPVAIIEFLEGKSSNNVTDYHIEQLGSLVAHMHKAAEDFPQSRENTMSFARWKTMLSEMGGAVNEIEPDLYKVIEGELSYLEKNWPKELPSGVIHADIFPDNVFFEQEKLSGIIDFYFSCHDLWMYDLMITVNAWCFNGLHEFMPARAKLLLQSYHRVRPITAEERTAIQILARGAALRFLMTRCYDKINRVEGALVTVKDPIEYLKKLRFYQQNNPLTPI